MRTPRWLGDGLFWMRLWLTGLTIAILWGVVTMATPLRYSVVNVNAMSSVTFIFAAAGGVQATLAMRKADNRDDL